MHDTKKAVRAKHTLKQEDTCKEQQAACESGSKKASAAAVTPAAEEAPPPSRDEQGVPLAALVPAQLAGHTVLEA